MKIDLSIRASRECRRNGQVLIEFALVAFVMFALLALVFDFGRAIFSAQVVQQSADHVARQLAREAAKTAAEQDLDEATVDQILRNQNIYSEDFLVVDITNQDKFLVDYLDEKKIPSANRLLIPLMIVMNSTQNPNIPAGKKWLVYPGEMVPSQTAETGFTILIPMFLPGGQEIASKPVVEKNVKLGVATVNVNYPFQAAAISGRHGDGPPKTPQDAYIEVPAGEQLQPGQVGGPYSGPRGLGQQAAFAKTVRPYRRVVTGIGVNGPESAPK